MLRGRKPVATVDLDLQDSEEIDRLLGRWDRVTAGSGEIPICISIQLGCISTAPLLYILLRTMRGLL